MSAILIGQQAAPLPHLLRGGGTAGLLVIALGVVLTLWGVWNLLRVRNRILIALQAFCSLIPAVICTIVAVGLYQAYLPIASSPVAPRPAEIAVLISKGLLIGMIGPLATVIPAALGIAALVRVPSGPSSDDAVYQNA